MGFAAVADLLPQAPPMVLLDEVLEWTDRSARTAVTVREDQPFGVPGLGIPAHVGIELMAQTCGVFAGLEAKALDKPVAIGFLLGCRRYEASLSWFSPGTRLVVGVTVVFREGTMAVFDCRIEADQAVLATARLTLYQPDGSPADLSAQTMG